jgi:hypothetical protein
MFPSQSAQRKLPPLRLIRRKKMKKIVLAAMALAILGTVAADARPHRHKVCFVRHHHRVCSWR